MDTPPRTKNTYLWLAWLSAAFIMCVLTYNPLHLLSALIALVATSSAMGAGTRGFLRVGLFFGIMPLVFNVFFTHIGSTSLFEVPNSIGLFGIQIPVFLIAGSITLESVMFGFIAMIMLLNLVLAFGVFSRVVSPDELLRVVPSAFSKSALAVVIALRFVPTISEDARRIRDCQMSRGVSFKAGARGIKNHLSLVLPLITNSLERSYRLAESMESRHFCGKRSSYKKALATKSDVLAACALAFAALFMVYEKLSGNLSFWPYDSVSIQPDYIALIPFVLLVVLKDAATDKI